MLPSPIATDRGISPAFGAVLLVGITVVTAAVFGTVLFGQAAALDGPPPTASFAVEADGDRVELSHEGGETVNVGTLRVQVAIDGESLAQQPPVPFFAARGYHGGPRGPFNPRTDGEWSVGETASFRIAETNDPTLEPGARLTVELYHGDQRFASVSTRIGG